MFPAVSTARNTMIATFQLGVSPSGEEKPSVGGAAKAGTLGRAGGPLRRLAHSPAAEEREQVKFPQPERLLSIAGCQEGVV
jgi:hypothetical protein